MSWKHVSDNLQLRSNWTSRVQRVCLPIDRDRITVIQNITLWLRMNNFEEKQKKKRGEEDFNHLIFKTKVWQLHNLISIYQIFPSNCSKITMQQWWRLSVTLLTCKSPNCFIWEKFESMACFDEKFLSEKLLSKKCQIEFLFWCHDESATPTMWCGERGLVEKRCWSIDEGDSKASGEFP